METIEGVSARVDHIEQRMATEADLSGVKAELYKAINDQTWKLITFVTAINGLLVAAVYYIATHVRG
jgi:hypothetical protein